jgi:hypothetical protein
MPRFVSNMKAIAILFTLCGMPVALAAEETFDLATFEPPAGWERVASPGVLAFRAATGDAQVALFPSVPSKAGPAENFAAEWARLVTAPLGRMDAPQLSTQPSR